MLVAGQALNQQLRRRRRADHSLKAMGCDTGQLVLADVLYAATVVGVGVLLAVALAVAASPLFPVGPVRRAHVVRGADVDVAALGGGAALVAVAVLMLVGLASWQRRKLNRPLSPGRIPAALASRPAPATGLRLVAASRGSWKTVAGVAAGLAIVVAAMTFTGSVGRLIAEPALVGLSWDVGGQASFDAVDREEVRAKVRDEAGVERVTGLAYFSGTVNGAEVVVAGLDGMKGSPWPPVVAGRTPVADDEVLVGSATLDQLGIGLGDSITIEVVSGGFAAPFATSLSPPLEVVGSAVAPAIGQPGADTPKLAVGILALTAALGVPDEARASSVVLFDLADGTEPADLIRRFPDGLPVARGSGTDWFTTATPAEVSQAGSARTVIWLGVGALAVAIVGTVLHTLLGSVRQRRGRYALLKAIGFTRGQVRTTVLCQSGALLLLALLLALPIGVAAGRWLWTAFAQRIGIVPSPSVPVLLLAGSVLATFALGQGAALVPASLARRTPLAQTLRSE